MLAAAAAATVDAVGFKLATVSLARLIISRRETTRDLGLPGVSSCIGVGNGACGGGVAGRDIYGENVDP